VEVVWHTQALRAVPARAIQHEDDLLAGTRANGLGKGSEFGFEKRHIHRRRAVKDRATGGRMDKADEIAPVVAMAAPGRLDAGCLDSRPCVGSV